MRACSPLPLPPKKTRGRQTDSCPPTGNRGCDPPAVTQMSHWRQGQLFLRAPGREDEDSGAAGAFQSRGLSVLVPSAAWQLAVNRNLYVQTAGGEGKRNEERAGSQPTEPSRPGHGITHARQRPGLLPRRLGLQHSRMAEREQTGSDTCPSPLSLAAVSSHAPQSRTSLPTCVSKRRPPVTKAGEKSARHELPSSLERSSCPRAGAALARPFWL